VGLPPRYPADCPGIIIITIVDSEAIQQTVYTMSSRSLLSTMFTNN